MKPTSSIILGMLLISSVFGEISYTLHEESSPTQDQQEAYRLIKTAMDSAIGYYNTYTTISKALNVYYNPDVATADASFNGTMRFGNRTYMVVHTAMHEIAHTVGSGTSDAYWNLMVDGVFTGAHATQTLREITSDPTAELHGDNTHFWPYGLNYASEVKSDEDLVNHCKIVNAMYKDMFNEEFYKICRIKSGSGSYMVSDGSGLLLGLPNDSSSLVQLISVNGENTFRLEFGNKVLDIPNESTASGVTVGLYNWNGGGHQKVIFEFITDSTLRIKMSHSGLYLTASGNKITQETGVQSSAAQVWEIVDETVGSVAKVNAVKHGTSKIKVVNGSLNLTLGDLNGKPAVLRITDLNGRTMLSQTVNYGKIVCPVSKFAKGVYVLRISCGKALEFHKFVVR